MYLQFGKKKSQIFILIVSGEFPTNPLVVLFVYESLYNSLIGFVNSMKFQLFKLRKFSMSTNLNWWILIPHTQSHYEKYYNQLFKIANWTQNVLVFPSSVIHNGAFISTSAAM